MRKHLRIIAILFLFLFLSSCSAKEKTVGVLEERITTFLETVFGDQKILNMNNATDDEISRFAFHVGMYKGTVHERPVGLLEGLTKQQIEENIRDVFGKDFNLDKLDYENIMVERINEDGTYVPAVYGAPTYGFKYVIHEVTNLTDNKYEAVISYIDINADVVTFDSQSNRIPPDYASQNMKIDDRKNEIEKLKNKILACPEKYERVKLLLIITDDHISQIGAENIK